MAAFDQKLARAIELRLGIPELSDGSTDAYRIVDGDGDGLPGVSIDTFAGHWLVQTKDVPFPDALRMGELPPGCRALWWKKVKNHGREEPELIAGEPSTTVVAKENGLSFLIDFRSGYSQGIFLDQRKNRKWVSETVSEGDRVLNLFAYTGAFSVAAAVGGAVATTVDLSGRYLDWSRENFKLNRINVNDSGAEGEHCFFKWDTFEFLQRSIRKGERYQLIINDPPTFSRNKRGKVFQVQNDYGSLVESCVRALAEGGSLLTSTNYRGFSRRELDGIVRNAAISAGREVKSLSYPEMPADFTGDPYLLACRLTV